MSDRGPSTPGEHERTEIEAKIRDAIRHNENLLRSVPEEVHVNKYWATLQREGRAMRMRVRNPDGTEIEQSGMYLLEENNGSIEMTYFDEQGVGERFWVELDRIIVVE